MSFNILYVENNHKDWSRVQEAVRAFNKSNDSDPLWVERAESPEDVKDKLNLRFDLIIADVFFDDPVTKEPDKVDRLDDIIAYTKQWNADSQGRPLPIIAYTRSTKAALDSCLRRKEDLYDIWDKNTASPDYVAWRLSRIASEVSRIRPDAMLQRLVREMPKGARWHEHVVDMAKRYDTGWTERDQIERVETAIVNIARSIGEADPCRRLWQVMIDWEPLSRAVSHKTRGHARHVINVFWLGYYLIHNQHLNSSFAKWWTNLVSNRPDMKSVANEEPLEALSNAWFFAGLFHDVGGCVENAVTVNDWLHSVVGVFGDLAPQKVSITPAKRLLKKARHLLAEFGDQLGGSVRRVFEKSVADNRPDQGIIAALHLRNVFASGAEHIYAREGGRAAALHNMFPILNNGEGSLPVSWTDDPIVCLLLLCDQLQTWDRERGDQTRWDDSPYRAELSSLNIVADVGRPCVDISIDYIAPAHLSYAPSIYGRQKDRLNSILQSHPEKSLKRIERPWPFKLTINCSLSGDPLNPPITVE